MQTNAIPPVQKIVLQYHFIYFPASKERHTKPAWLVLFSENAKNIKTYLESWCILNSMDFWGFLKINI